MSEIRADTINNASGDNDSGIDLSTNDQVSIKTANTTAVTVDASQNVGIGTSSPSRLLTVNGSTAFINIDSGANSNQRGIEFDYGGSQINGSLINFGATGETSLSGGASGSAGYFLTFKTNGSERMRITSGGNIGFGSIASNDINTSIAFTATGDGTHSDHFFSFGPHATANDPSFYTINESGTGVYLGHGNNSWSAHSDERIKENITSLENVLPDIVNIRCVKYNLKGQTATKIGFIAQDWETNFSEVVDEKSRQVIESDGSLSFEDESESTTAVKALSYTETIPVLLKAIQELKTELDEAKARIEALENA